MRRVGPRVIAAVVATLWVLGCSCCSAHLGTTGAQRQSASSASSQERLASSIGDYIQQQLDTYDSLPDYQRDVLRRSIKRGRISAKDYETAWSDYKQCVLDKGYREVILVKMYNGVYAEASSTGGTKRQYEQFDKAENDCRMEYLDQIDLLYKIQVGNPSLYADQDEAVVDCLRRKNVVKDSYTAKDFRREVSSGRHSFDWGGNKDANACLVSNGYVYLKSDTPLEHPFGK